MRKFNFLVSLMVCLFFQSFTFARQENDSDSVYFKSCLFLSQGNHELYKYGNVKPKNIQDAFCVFLTGDSVRLLYFKNLDLNAAVIFALKKENGIMRYDWGSESFRGFSKYIISHYDLWAPYLQYNLAVRCFHYWMNYCSPPIKEIASHLRKAYKEENKFWKFRFREFTKYANNEHLKGKAKRKYQRVLRKSRACML